MIETYGFVIYISTFAAAFICLCWVYIPDYILNNFGITYYPSKYWAATFPSFMIVAYFSWFVYYNLSVLIITQPRRKAASCYDSYSKPSNYTETYSISPLYDVPIDEINKKMYF